MCLDLIACTVLLTLACGGGEAEPFTVEIPPAEVDAPAPEAEPPPSAPADSACPEGEPRFRCPVKGDKEILVCGTGWGLQYRYGPLASPELVYPTGGPSGAFTYEERSYAQSMGDVLSFTNEGTTYEVQEMVGSGMGDPEANNFAGVVVLEGDEELARVPCTGEPVSDWSTLSAALQ